MKIVTVQFLFNCFIVSKSLKRHFATTMSFFEGKVRTALDEVKVGDGKFIRVASGYREIIQADHPIYQPEKDRYHLYISLACPWANRCLATIRLKGLQDCISVNTVHPSWQRTKPNDPEDVHCGWVFNTGALSSAGGCGSVAVPHCTLDTVNKADSIRDVYELNKDTYKKFSVPILWDKKTNSIVNNESSEILRMLTKEFDAYATGPYASYGL